MSKAANPMAKSRRLFGRSVFDRCKFPNSAARQTSSRWSREKDSQAGVITSDIPALNKKNFRKILNLVETNNNNSPMLQPYHMQL